MNRRRMRPGRLTQGLVEGEGLPAGRVPDEEDVEAFRVAIALRAGRPGADLPTEEFVTRLRRELAAEVGSSARPASISRRRILMGAVAAAAGAAGAAADRALPHPPASQRAVSHPADLEPVGGRWVPVADEADLAAGTAVRFEASGVVGFLSQAGADLTAVSGVCTHQGCLLRGNAQARRLECPCHMSMFTYGGALMGSRLHPSPPPLPRLQVRRNEGHIEVLLPPPPPI